MTTCAHCLSPQRGSAQVNDSPLCHPDDGLDCYHLVTVYGHAMPCPTLRADRYEAHREDFHGGHTCPTDDCPDDQE